MTKKTIAKPKDKKDIAKARAELAKGAEPIRAARVVNNTNGGLPEIEECTMDIAALMAKRVKVNTVLRSLELDDDTTTGEYFRIFDNLLDYSEGFQFLFGDLILKGEVLAAFKVKGVSKYRDMMLSTGRSLDSLKAYRSVALHTPPELRLLGYTQTRETVKIPKLEDRKAVIEKFAEQVKQGKNPSVLEVRAAADKLAPRRTKGKKPTVVVVPVRDITKDEEPILKELEDEASHLCTHLEMSEFVFALRDSTVKKLRELLGRLAASHLRLTT